MKKTLITLFAICFLCISAGLTQVQKPSDLKFPPLKYDPPNPKNFRIEFSNGLRGYIQEDHSLPLFNISAIINFGGLYVPKDKQGLNSVMSETLIDGGTKTKEGTVIKERIEFLGGSLSFRADERTSTLSLTILSKDFDEGLDLFFDVLMNPEFREAPLNLAKVRLIQGLRRANDQPSGILRREYERLIYGDHPLTRQPNKTTYESIAGADLKALHAEYFFPKNIILAASGDFNKSKLKAKINKIWASRTPALTISLFKS
jgi:predicted Zn-dependent peptidase